MHQEVPGNAVPNPHTSPHLECARRCMTRDMYFLTFLYILCQTQARFMRSLLQGVPCNRKKNQPRAHRPVPPAPQLRRMLSNGLHSCSQAAHEHHSSMAPPPACANATNSTRVCYRKEQAGGKYDSILASHIGLPSIPVIDAAEFMHQGNKEAPPPPHVVSQIKDAASNWGFFQLINSGISQQLLDQHYEATKDFFKLPREQKLSCKRTPTNAMGWFDDEYTKRKLDVKQCFDFRHVPYPSLPDSHADNYDPQGVNQWPENRQDFRDIQAAYFAEMERVAFRLLEALALGLGLQAKALHPLFETTHTSFLRLNYYPVTPGAPADALGISDHKDAGFLTLLLQDEVPGLQVLRDGVWHLVEPQPGALTINIGDMAQVLSNDHFIAANHRVLQSSTYDRYSRAFFFNPKSSADIAPLPGLVAADRGPRYRAINWQDFRMQRFAGDYADVGEEVQIDWYRLEGDAGKQ